MGGEIFRPAQDDLFGMLVRKAYGVWLSELTSP